MRGKSWHHLVMKVVSNLCDDRVLHVRGVIPFTHSAVTQDHQLGIDIEYPKENIAINDLVKRFFAPVEVAAFQNLADEQRREAFFNAWTRKEAYLKACGGGLSIGLDRVLVAFLPGQPARIVEIDRSQPEAARWSAAALYPGPGYQAALVALGKAAERDMRIVEGVD